MTIAVGVEKVSVVDELNREEVFLPVELVEVNFIVGTPHSDQGVVLSYFDNTRVHLCFKHIQYFARLVVPYFYRGGSISGEHYAKFSRKIKQTDLVATLYITINQ